MVKLLLVLIGLLPASARAQPAAKPRIAVVIDDFGLTYKKNEPDAQWMKISWPVTFAVMPESPVTAQAAKQTKENGHELIIHFPFDPFLRLDLPKDEASEADIAKVSLLMAKAFHQIPGAAGLNNHRSVKATMNKPLMDAFMELLKPKGIYFIDSKVSAKTVAYAEAKAAGIKTAQNYIFLEEPGHYNDKAFAVRMLKLAAAHAKKTGQVVVIGHHYFHGTYDGLMEEVPELQAEGFEFVFASQLVR